MTEALVKHRILCEFNGEVSTTPSAPMAVWTGQVDLTEQKTFILSNDDWRQVGGPRYEVREVELPYWLGAREWVINYVYWRYTWAAGVETSWPESWQRGLMELAHERRLACVKLLTTREFRSGFRLSLRMQLVAWLEDRQRAKVFSGKPPQYESPFSRNQWEKLLDVHTVRAARQNSEHLYSHRSAPGVLVPSLNAGEQHV